MGEHKIPKAPPARPGMAILRLKQSVAASRGQTMDRDTQEFMVDLATAIAWIDHLESKEPPCSSDTPESAAPAKA